MIPAIDDVSEHTTSSLTDITIRSVPTRGPNSDTLSSAVKSRKSWRGF